MVPTFCLTCGVVIARGKRCAVHTRQFNKERNARPNRLAYQDPAYQAWIKADRCERCGTRDDLTKDHVIPLIRGGTNDPSNLQTLCRQCNARKGTLIQ